jgi:hypothetical protein
VPAESGEWRKAMADRRVTQSGKGQQEDITSLCNPSEYWSPRAKADAINDIETRVHRYYVDVPGVGAVDIHVAKGPTGKYLRTDPDKTTKNNLLDLPNC